MDRPFGSCVLVSFGYRVRFSVTVAQDLNEINQIIFLLLSELEISYLPVRLCRRGRLGWWYSRDVLNVVEDLGRREERSVAGRRTVAKVEDDLFAVGVHRNVSLIIEVDDLRETLEDAVVHVGLYEL